MQLELKEIVALVGTFLIVVSAAYLFGYWGTFNVNVLEFIGVTDIAKIAVYPLLISLSSAIAGAGAHAEGAQRLEYE